MHDNIIYIPLSKGVCWLFTFHQNSTSLSYSQFSWSITVVISNMSYPSLKNLTSWLHYTAPKKRQSKNRFSQESPQPSRRNIFSRRDFTNIQDKAQQYVLCSSNNMKRKNYMVLKLILLNSFFPDESLKIFMHTFKGSNLHHVVIRLIFNTETRHLRI